MFSQYHPILWVPCMDLYIKSCIFGLIGFLLRLSHMASLVSRVLLKSWRPECILSMFLAVVLLGAGLLDSRIPL